MSKERLDEIERQLNRAEIKRENLDMYGFQNILEHQLINGNLLWLVKYAKEQAERVQELEKQNKRYREYLELIKTIGTHGKDIKTGEIIRSDEANLADEALGDK